MDGSRSAKATERPIFFKPWASPIETVVLPSPAGVGVMAETKIKRPRTGRPARAAKETFALSRP